MEVLSIVSKAVARGEIFRVKFVELSYLFPQTRQTSKFLIFIFYKKRVSRNMVSVLVIFDTYVFLI